MSITTDAKLTFGPNTAVIKRKCQEQLYFFSKLRSLDVSTHVLQTFYKYDIERSVIFDFFIWYSGLSVAHRNIRTFIHTYTFLVTFVPIMHIVRGSATACELMQDQRTDFVCF